MCTERAVLINTAGGVHSKDRNCISLGYGRQRAVLKVNVEALRSSETSVGMYRLYGAIAQTITMWNFTAF
jgi:hypothetical protein